LAKNISMKPKIGFVGVGKMGANMARHLVDIDYEVVAVYDVNKSVAESLSHELSIQPVTSLASVTAAADVIITVVTNDAAMQQIYHHEQGQKIDSLLVGAAGKTFINCATLSPSIQQEIDKSVQQAGAYCLEAAMASSIDQARQGTLYLMVGGDKAVFEAQQPLLNALSKDLQYVGEMGSAAKVKALVNMVMNINTAALAEGLGLGDALGLDIAMLRKVFSQTGAASRVLETDAEDMQIRDHECYFSCEHAAKDSSIANNLADICDLEVPLSKATQAQYDKLVQIGLGHLDKSAVAELTFKGRYTS